MAIEPGPQFPFPEEAFPGKDWANELNKMGFTKNEQRSASGSASRSTSCIRCGTSSNVTIGIKKYGKFPICNGCQIDDIKKATKD